MNLKFLFSVLNILILCVIIATVSIFVVNNTFWIGPAMLMLAILCVVSLVPFKVNIKEILPDIIFGVIDNGILAIFAIFGAHFAGVAGAIIGGVVGNSVTDGIAGIFEGHTAERLRLRAVLEERTMLKSSVGKMAGCLLGAGLILIANSIIKF
ncbi:hypothetical protein COT94_04000 [Candidatus Falkowbacteria bacterium CG10_big_fil_rev_8_21_14_0_10_37_14]|uniref:Uncharacterized protein n=1 Tax=Candidatus Falkowbacteria bacterium CG10_big_fil_rev_8_21_14_0_10_37_14 TaxID=1974561 RepID=A0A2M6WSI3_9BACT|nr:hypothetical protein [Candidatus Falkowbacteria bacterium]PIT95722.1 MAG: hypothetical protein COT94_04000 [Candidatus Falkowbacteria bacterium CG10_big_fil_rev_8_21_14_0_10_37_14]